jgi:hypothetical protein
MLSDNDKLATFTLHCVRTILHATRRSVLGKEDLEDVLENDHQVLREPSPDFLLVVRGVRSLTRNTSRILAWEGHAATRAKGLSQSDYW